MKKFIKIFLFSFILVFSVFIFKSVNAMTFDDIYNDISLAAANEYYGETLEETKTVCPDSLIFPDKETLLDLINNSNDASKQDFLNYFSTADYYCILVSQFNSNRHSLGRDIILIVMTESDYNSWRYWKWYL